MKSRIGMVLTGLSLFSLSSESKSQPTYNCSTCITQLGGGGPAHSFQWGLGADFKDVPNPFHTAFKPNYCSQHHGICQYAFTAAELIEQPQHVAGSGEESQLQSFLLRHANVARYNKRRGALQLLNCAGDVILSAPFTRDARKNPVQVRAPMAARSGMVSSYAMSTWIGADAITSPFHY